MNSVTIEHISQEQRRAARATGRAWWFGPDETRFFSSRIESEVFTYSEVHYFVTSEQCEFSDGSKAPRLFTIRSWDPGEPARIKTHGKFQEYRSKDEAIDGLLAMVKKSQAY